MISYFSVLFLYMSRVNKRRRVFIYVCYHFYFFLFLVQFMLVFHLCFLSKKAAPFWSFLILVSTAHTPTEHTPQTLSLFYEQ